MTALLWFVFGVTCGVALMSCLGHALTRPTKSRDAAYTPKLAARRAVPMAPWQGYPR